MPRKLQIHCSLNDPGHTYTEIKGNGMLFPAVRFHFQLVKWGKYTVFVENTVSYLSSEKKYLRTGNGKTWWELKSRSSFKCTPLILCRIFVVWISFQPSFGSDYWVAELDVQNTKCHSWLNVYPRPLCSCSSADVSKSLSCWSSDAAACNRPVTTLGVLFYPDRFCTCHGE